MKVLTTAKVPVKMWVDGVDAVEPDAITQLRNTADLPFIYKHVAVMPDVHVGKGATVGSVVPTKGAIVPACVGVDIGCGMMYLRTNLTASDLPDTLKPLRDAIEDGIPLGKSGYGDKFTAPMPKQVEQVWSSLSADERFKIVAKNVETKRAECQVGTLGGGNHFIEIVLDQHQQVGIMLHSGSRGIGNKIGQHFIDLARVDMRKHFINLPDKDLAYLSEGTQHFDDYVAAVEWAQDYALANRKVMLDRVLMAMRDTLRRSVTHRMEEPIVSCHHNYVAKEHHCATCIDIQGSDSHRLVRLLDASYAKARDFLAGYQPCFHSCGGLLLTAADTDQALAPSQVDALIHDRRADALKDVQVFLPGYSPQATVSVPCGCAAPERTVFSWSSFLSKFDPGYVHLGVTGTEHRRLDNLVEQFFLGSLDAREYLRPKCAANHDAQSVWVTRKGAVRAREGELGIIPGSMGAKSFIVRGKGNAESFNSCSHGAGRRMSRTAAKERISQAEHEAALAGIECRTDGTRDESPAAYKSIEAVMAAQADLCEPVLELHQVLCVKG